VVHSTLLSKKAVPLKTVHDRFRASNRSTAARGVPPGEKMAFEQSFGEGKTNHNLYKYLKKAMDNLNRLIVLNMFKHIVAIYCEL